MRVGIAQITTTTQAGDIVVIVPGAVIRWVGFLGVFCGFVVAFLVFAAGYVLEGLLCAVLTLGVVPVWMLFHYIFWRFHWYLLLISMIIMAMVCGGSLIVGTRISPNVANSQFGSTLASFLTISPANVLIAFIIALLLTAVLYRLWSLRSKPRTEQVLTTHAAQAGTPGTDDFDFGGGAADEPLLDKVLAKLERTGAKGQVQGNTIHAYKGDKLVAIVRVIDRPAAISPLLVKDVANQRDRTGAGKAYLATSGFFTDDTRAQAAQWDVKLMTV